MTGCGGTGIVYDHDTTNPCPGCEDCETAEDSPGIAFSGSLEILSRKEYRNRIRALRCDDGDPALLLMDHDAALHAALAESQREVERLREDLDAIAHKPLVCGPEASYRECYHEMVRLARAALNETEGGEG